MPGCDGATCRFAQGWRCIQPGSPGVYDIEGPVPIPGPDGTVLTVDGIRQGWGAVPRGGQAVQCWCANGAGTYANESTGCVAEVCPYPSRCVVRGEPKNGTVCTEGSESVACTKCSRRFYKFRDECRRCPSGVPPGMVLLGVTVGVFVIYVGPSLSRFSSPQAVSLLRSTITYCQVRQPEAQRSRLRCTHSACVPLLRATVPGSVL